MSSKGPTKDICEWVCTTRYEDIPEDVRQEALRLLLDQVGGMLASSTLISCKPVVDLVRELGGPAECTIIGHPFRAPLLNAAMANGAIGHADEVDATSIYGAGHFAATMVPTALTAGQYLNADGKTFARAFVLGAEIAARMQTVINAHQDARPEFYYSPGAALGAAVTTGLLLGLDADKMEHTLGTAAMGIGPLTSLHHETLHQSKALAYSGRTARAGIESAFLARQGMHGPRDILTCKNGFCHAFVGSQEAGHEAVVELGKTYLMKDLLYKRYSAGGPNLAPLYAYYQLQKQHKFTADDIVSIEVRGMRPGSDGIFDHHPSIHTETVLSLAACYGEYRFEHAHDTRYCEDPRFVEFRKRVPVTLVPRQSITGRVWRLKAGMTVRTRNGGAHDIETDHPLMTTPEIEQKFRDLAGLRLDQARRTELERKLKTIESIDNVAKLVSDLEIA